MNVFTPTARRVYKARLEAATKRADAQGLIPGRWGIRADKPHLRMHVHVGNVSGDTYYRIGLDDGQATYWTLKSAESLRLAKRLLRVEANL